MISTNKTVTKRAAYNILVLIFFFMVCWTPFQYALGEYSIAITIPIKPQSSHRNQIGNGGYPLWPWSIWTRPSIQFSTRCFPSHFGLFSSVSSLIKLILRLSQGRSCITSSSSYDEVISWADRKTLYRHPVLTEPSTKRLSRQAIQYSAWSK